MKKNKKFEMSFILFAIIILLLIVAIIIANFLIHGVAEWKTILTDLLNDILSVAVVGVIATIITKVISDNFFKIKKNNDKLLSFGVESIGGGKSTDKDILDLFGDAKKDNFPEEIKLMFITGNGFFKTFKKDIIECLSKSDCYIKVLLVSPDESNHKYLTRCEKLCEQKTPYVDQINKESLKYLNEIGKVYPNRIELRYYKDEYRYNFRIAKYRNKNASYDSFCWLNVQPLNKDSVDLSVALKGKWDSEMKNIEDNIFYQLDKSFDNVWQTYEDTAILFN